jgi:hypothetical protein
MTNGSTLVAALAVTLGLLATPAGAQHVHRHGVHEHGKVTLNIARDGELLAIDLEAPAVNVVGFERAARTDAERERLAEAERMLRSGRGLFGVPAAARCELTEAEVEVPDFSGKGAGAHGEYHARLRYRCARPEALAWVEPWVLGRLTGVKEARVNVLTPKRQDALTTADPRSRLPLQ